MKDLEKEAVKEAYIETMKRMYGDIVDEASTSKIGGNWKPIVDAFHKIFDGFDRLGTLGALKDKKYGKKLRDIEDKLVTLTNMMDKEFGGGMDEIV